MKKLLVILLITLATCTTFEESSDDNVILEKSGFSIKHTVSHPTKPHFPKTHAPRTHAPITHAPKTHAPITHAPITHVPITHVPITNVPKTDIRKNLKEVKKLPVKGVNGLFGGKVGEVFRKLGEMVKKGIAWLKKNKLWDPIIEQLKGLGQKYGNELCEKALSPEICGPAIDFALEHLLPSGQK